MTIRVLLALLITGALAIVFLIAQRIGQVLAELPVQGNEGFFGFLLSQRDLISPEALYFFVTAIPVAAIFFLVISILVVRPLRLIEEALKAFVARSERIVLPSFRSSPQEVRQLAAIFQEFADQVEIAHARDVEISRVKSDFISTAAHQLRTPLTGIRWAIEALEREPLSESQKALLKNAVDKSHDLVAIVGTLLDISSIESGKYAYKFHKQDMAQLATEVVKDFAVLADRTNVNLSVDIPESLPPVSIDRDRMKWVLNNLIENAIHYTPSGGNVTVSATSVANRLILRVRDTGIGIPASDRNNIFERFYRAGNAVTKQNKGSGLGLYIARTIVNDHGGELSFEANVGGTGTTFILALPVASSSN